MMSRTLLPVLALLAATVPAMAQDAGGVRLAPGLKGGPVGLAKPLPFTRPPLLTAQDMQGGLSASDRQAKNQDMITRLRGDPGFLGGFQFGTPLAASLQAQAAVPNTVPDDGGYQYRRHHGHGSGPVIINNTGPLAVTVGNNNSVQQQSASGSGPIALQQVASPGGAASHGGAVNVASDTGNIVQRAPRGK